MSFHLLNPWMLLGLAGLALPVLAHLLSRRRYDVVQWGAMQFLELGRNTRRRIRLEQILLMLLRMGLIALLAFALARPWAQGGWLANLVSSQPRDVVIVLDGSYSMGWEGKAATPHAAGVQWVHRFLEELRPGDTVAVLDARDHVRGIVDPPTRDFRYVREKLAELPKPSGTSNLSEAASKGVQILSRTNNLARDIVVLTDGQAKGWRPDDANLWARFDDLRQQPAVTPRVWVIDVSDTQSADRTNYSVDKVELSREMTVPEFPVRITTKVKSAGGTAPSTRRVHLELDGQRLTDRSLSVQLPPSGEAPVEFEYRFQTVGSHVVSVVLDDDNLPGDNRSDAAIVCAEALPVLLVDGAPNLDPTKSETFFAKAALSASTNRTPWIKATVVSADELTPEHPGSVEVVVLANVKRLPEATATAVKEFAAGGGGVLIALGDQIDPAAWNEAFYEQGRGLLPASLERIEKDPVPELKGIRVLDASLELPWMTRFQAKNDGGFTEARFSHWWKVALPPAATTPAATRDPANATPDAAKPAGKAGPQSPRGKPPVETSPPLVAARLDSKDVFLVTRRYGRGGAALLTVPLDADWSTFPAKADYVPFLHETIFLLASGKTARNVDAGMPLILPVPEDLPLKKYAFFGPGETEFAAEPAGDAAHPLARLLDTSLPGTYTFRHKDEAAANAPLHSPEHFVVNFDRTESDLTPLDDTQRAVLSKGGRMTFAKSLDELKQGMFTDSSRAEFWHLLMLVFLAILVGEVVMTRRLVQGGHAVVDEEPVEAEDFAEAASEGRTSSSNGGKPRARQRA